MKKKALLVTAVVAILLASCVVKSLNPFYTKETLAYDASLLGKWEDGKHRVWEVQPMLEVLDVITEKKEISLNKKLKGEVLQNTLKELKKNKATVKAENITVFQKERKEKGVEKDSVGFSDIDSIQLEGKVSVSKKELLFENEELDKIYKNAYVFTKEREDEKGREDAFIVVPFQVNGQVFLDFTPLGSLGVEDFVEMHYVGIHTLAKLDRKGSVMQISWLSESKIQKLFKQKKIRIAHQKIGTDGEDVLLTASSDELQKFIAKYINFDDEEKWGDSVKLTLNRIK